MATEVFGKGPEEFGALGSIMAIGSLVAALMSARRANPRLRHLLVSLAGFTLAATAAALAPNYVTFAVLLVPLGLSALTAMTTANAMVQLRTDPSMRGRVMALYMAVFMGGTPIGAPLIGWIGDVFGARWTIGIGPIAIGQTLLVVGRRLWRVENVHVHLSRHHSPHLWVTTGAPTPEPAR